MLEIATGGKSGYSVSYRTTMYSFKRKSLYALFYLKQVILKIAIHCLEENKERKDINTNLYITANKTFLLYNIIINNNNKLKYNKDYCVRQ